MRHEIEIKTTKRNGKQYLRGHCTVCGLWYSIGFSDLESELFARKTIEHYFNAEPCNHEIKID